jgi:hypothetical protein
MANALFEVAVAYIPGNPPFPLLCIASIWRIIFFEPPPFIIRIIFCICWRYRRIMSYNGKVLRITGGIKVYSGNVWHRYKTPISMGRGAQTIAIFAGRPHRSPLLP